MCQAPQGSRRCGCYSPTKPLPPGTRPPTQSGVPPLKDSEVEGMREAAQQFFEASVANFGGNAVQKAVYVTECLQRWPWLRPNRWMKESGDETDR